MPRNGDNRLWYSYVSTLADQEKRAREPYQLPAGRHGLPRQFVVTNQRQRILAAVADVCSAEGYVSMSVEDIVVTSGVSRRTFYDNYRGKEDAFLAAYDEVSAQLLARVQEAYDAADGLVDRARECLRALLNFIASEPTFADMCIVEVLAAGPQAIARRNTIMSAMAALIDQACRRGAAEDQAPGADHRRDARRRDLRGHLLARAGGPVRRASGAAARSRLRAAAAHVGTEVAQEILKKERRRAARGREQRQRLDSAERRAACILQAPRAYC